MPAVRLTPLARQDLEDIWIHVAGDSLRAADQLIESIVDRCNGLQDFPELGPARPDVAPEARMLTIGDYIVLYRRVTSGAEIVRVTHGARRLETLWPPGGRLG
jgi:toxin ParE1/3/4